MNSFKCVSVHSRLNWNLEVLVFAERGKQEYPEKSLLQQEREPTLNSTQALMPRLEPGPHWYIVGAPLRCRGKGLTRILLEVLLSSGR